MLSEDQGVEAIIALQKLAGVFEPKKEARENWKRFSDTEKSQTESAHKTFCGGFPENDKSD